MNVVPGPDLSGRRAVVTGGASGIGAAVASRLAGLGAHVAVCDVDAEGAARTAEQIGGEALAIDLSKTADLAERQFNADILVNNAGIQHVAPIDQFEPERFAFMLRLMLEAPFLLTRAVLPQMYEQGWGRIVHISSVHGLRASAYKSAYVSAKHGLLGLSKVIALEGAAHGVTSNCVCPGYVRTPLVENQLADQAVVHGLTTDAVLSEVLLARSSVKRLIEPAEVAGAVAYLCSPDATSVTGTELVLDGGWSAS
ncbi:3-hydroxybutyrate dehydrogenase [Kribbella yunnanensis]|uniref:3-hydroxybutyrate dehydrogenase n=2 Tax=Kribbella yunnanensis TaxID=190194 RepID=A0ABP4V099_9ACTN